MITLLFIVLLFLPINVLGKTLSSPVYYKVKRGDSLYKIARKFHTSIKSIKKLNHLHSNIIHPGQRLLVREPLKITPLSRDPFFESLMNSSLFKTYLVKRREPLYKIAKKFGVSLLGLKNFNDLPTYYAKPGEILKIPIRPKPSKNLDFFKKLEFCHKIQRVYYRVKRGDSLYKIARKFHTSIKSIKKLNHLHSNIIHPGQRLLVRVIKVKNRCEELAGYILHTVEKGETLLKISQEYKVPIWKLRRINHLYGNKIVVGETLKIPVSVNDNTLADRFKHFCCPDFELDSIEKTELSKKLWEVAERYKYYRYKFGGNGNGYLDCSMFVKLVFDKFGIDLPRTARKQFMLGKKVYKGQLLPGDLVFFLTRGRYPSHVGIYLGNGKFMHFSPAHRGLAVNSLNEPYFKRHYLGAKRVFSPEFYIFFRSFLTELKNSNSTSKETAEAPSIKGNS